MTLKPPPELNVATAFKQPHWRSITRSKTAYAVVKTGYATLDQHLQLGGWPLGVSIELGLNDYGIGELRLLLPALREVLSGASPYTVWVAPPYLPFAPALVKENLNLDQVLVVRPNTVADALWATEQALQVNTCAAVFCWTGRENLSQKTTRRLQLAAEKSTTLLVQFRHSDCMQQASAARLRLNLQTNAQGCLEIVIHKQPQSHGGQHCEISLAPHYEQWQRIPADQLPEHNQSFVKTDIGRAAHSAVTRY